LDVLTCPECHSDSLKLKEDVYSRGEVREGTLSCDSCGRHYPIVNYVPRFVSSDKYVASFSFEWKNFPKVLCDLKAEDSFSRFNISLDELSGKSILDVGCGSGRFVEFFSRRGREVVGVDLSYSVTEALRYCRLRQNVHIVQADLFNLPFKEEIFDIVFSFGVLMHTPDTKKAFMQLPKHVKPGGKLAVFVYAKWFEMGSWINRTKEGLSDSYRKLTSKLPSIMLYGFSHIAIPLYEMKRVPKLGKLIDAAMPSSMHPDWRVRVLETFDWYSPYYHWKHTRTEVAEWFKEAGFEHIFISPHPVTVVGLRPLLHGTWLHQ